MPHLSHAHHFATLILLLGPASAAALQAGDSAPPSLTYFDVAHDPDFSGYKLPLQRLDAHHPHQGGNDFCVLGYAAGDGTKSAWILWPQGAEIFHWTGDHSPLDSPQTIHLKTDVVATDGEVGTSTYLVTKAWVKDLKHTCDARGEKLHLPARH